MLICSSFKDYGGGSHVCSIVAKYWCKVVDHLFSSLGLDKAEWLEDIRKGSCSLKSFLGVAGEGIDERESGKFEEGLNSKVKLSFIGPLVK